MGNLILKTDLKVNSIFENYPDTVRDKMQYLRELVLETAEAMPEVSVLEETLKWSEPSFVTKNGSTLRMDYTGKDTKPICYVFSMYE